MDAKLAVLLTLVAKWEQKIQIAREILGQDMNFSPAWLLTLLQKPGSTPEKFISITEFAHLFQYLKSSFGPQQITLIYDYFDAKKEGKIENKIFVEGLLPFQKTSLRKAVLKRLAENLEMTPSLKFAIKRFFLEVLNSQKQITTYQGFFDQTKAKNIQKYENLQSKEVHQFLKLFGKCLSDSEIALVMHSIEYGRIKAASSKFITQIIKQTLKLPFAQFTNNHQKTDSKTFSEKQNQSSSRKAKISTHSPISKFDTQINQQKLNPCKPRDSRRQLTQTPIERIREPQSIHFPKSTTFRKKNSNISDLSILDTMNDELNQRQNNLRIESQQKYTLQDQLSNLRSN